MKHDLTTAREHRPHGRHDARPLVIGASFGCVAASSTIALAAVFATGCIGYATGTTAAKAQVLQQAEKDLDCPQKEIQAEEELGGRWFASGCGRRARYNASCDHLQCSVSQGEGEAVPWRDRPDPDSTWPK